MSPHSFAVSLRNVLSSVHQDIHVFVPVSTEYRIEYPYLLLNLTTDEERIPRNDTWSCTLEVQLHTNAYDVGGVSARDAFSRVCDELETPELRKAVNNVAEDFYLYRMALVSVDEPQVQDDVFTQSARFRVLLQF